MFIELRELLCSGAIRRHQLGAKDLLTPTSKICFYKEKGSDMSERKKAAHHNILLYIICGFVLKSWILPLYSIVTYAAVLKTVDFIVEGIDRSKCAIIITEHPDERHHTQH